MAKVVAESNPPLNNTTASRCCVDILGTLPYWADEKDVGGKVILSDHATVAHFRVHASQINGYAFESVVTIDIGEIELTIPDLVDHPGRSAA